MLLSEMKHEDVKVGMRIWNTTKTNKGTITENLDSLVTVVFDKHDGLPEEQDWCWFSWDIPLEVIDVA